MARKIIQIAVKANSHYPLFALCDDGTAWELGPDDWLQVRPIPHEPDLQSEGVAHTSAPNAALNLHEHEVFTMLDHLGTIDRLLLDIRSNAPPPGISLRAVYAAFGAVAAIRWKLSPTASVTGARPNV